MPYTLLLVDDDRSFRQEFRDSFYDFNVVEASSGQEAMTLLKKPNEIDLVILDVMMPGASGTEVLKDIKAKYPQLGIIILTGYSSKDVAVEALKGKADEYIEKPIHVEKAREIILNLFEKKERPPESAGDPHEKIKRIKAFLDRNYQKKVSLEDAARLVCLSPKYLSRLFHEVTGDGFNEYKLRAKIEKAKELLKKTKYSVEQISYELGYQNLESFIRIFKKATKKTPTAYRKKPGR